MAISEKEFDEILTSALYSAAELDYGDVPTDEDLEHMVMLSARFQRKMRALLRNPTRYIRNRRRPMYLKALKGVAAAVITFALLLGSAMAVSPTVRATVTNFVRALFEDRTVYAPQGRAYFGEWVFDYMPDGFEIVYEMVAEYHIFRIFGDGEKYLAVTIAASTMTIDSEHHYHYKTAINGRTASVYRENTGEHPNKVIIFFEEQRTFVLLSSTLNVDELIKIAERISY